MIHTDMESLSKDELENSGWNEEIVKMLLGNGKGTEPFYEVTGVTIEIKGFGSYDKLTEAYYPNRDGYQLFAATVQGIGNIPQDVTWEIVGQQYSGITISDSGLFYERYTGDSEDVNVTVRAASVADPTKYADIKIRIDGAYIADPEFYIEPFRDIELPPGGSQQYTATDGFASISSYTWQVIDNQSASTTISADGFLNIADDETAESVVVRVIGDRVIGDQKYDRYARVYVNQPLRVTDLIVAFPWDLGDTPTVAVGDVWMLLAEVRGTGTIPQTVRWELTGNQSDRTRINPYGVLNIASDETAATMTVRATSDFSPTVFTEIHMIVETNSQRMGTLANPYIITTAEQLAQLAQRVNTFADDEVNGGKYTDKYYKLGNDIDLSGYGVAWNGGKGWTPIGRVLRLEDYVNELYVFRGSFDGAGYKITGLYINDNDLEYAGLFGYISYNEVKNLDLIDVCIIGDRHVGGLTGAMYSSTVTNCFVTGMIRGTRGDVGGVVGVALGAESASADDRDNEISSCRSECTVRGSYMIGGIVGRAQGIYYDSIVVTSCWTQGDINGNDFIGGIVGSLSGSMTNCYATGAVNGTDNVGGLVGQLFGSVENCYASGAIIGHNRVGGVVGYLWYGTAYECAALNPSVEVPHVIGNVSVGRVAGELYGSCELSNNIAYSDIACGFVPFPGENTATGRDGLDVSAAELQSSGGFPSGLLDLPWAYKPGSLPGLFGQIVDMPSYLRP